MATASASCASGDRAPSDMPAQSKRRVMDSIGSTSSSEMAAPALGSSRSRSVATGRSLTSREKAL